MFYFQCTCWNARVFEIIFRLNQVYSLLESKIKILLVKTFSQISLDILLRSLILACCKNKPRSSVKKFLVSERAFVLFYLAAVLVGIMLGLIQLNKDDGLGSFFNIRVSKLSDPFRSHTTMLAVSGILFLGIILNQRCLSSGSFC